MDYIYNAIPSILAVGGIIAASLIVSCSIVGHFLYSDEFVNNIISSENDEEIKKRLEQKKYEKSFFDELEKTEDITSTSQLNELINKYIIEDTPVATIKMCYCSDSETFWYYSKNKHIPYPTLDAVARKYSITHKCPSVCINYRKELEKVNEKHSDTNEENKDNDDKNSVYVKLKSYNKNVSEKKLVTVERSNRFTYKGVIVDEEEEENNTKSDMKDISFAEYKETMQSDKIKTL